MPNSELTGAGVLVTRPEGQANALCELIRAAGGRPVRFPVVAIEDPLDPAAADAAVDRLAGTDLAIFVSANAVEYGLARVRTRLGTLPEGVRLAAVGRATARALEREAGRPADLCPERHDSEGLLALPELQAVAGWRVVIFRGDGGRELLAETLRSRGAEVAYAEVYRRARPDADTAGLLAAWGRGEIDVVTVTSNEGLRNLLELLGAEGRTHLRTTPLVVLSARTAELAAELGLQGPVRVAPETSDQGMATALLEWAAGERTGDER